MLYFTRKHITVKAMQFNGENIREVTTFINIREPDTKPQYTSEKWEEFCAKIQKDGYMEIPSSLGYDPTYTNCLPTDYVVSPSPGVYTVMSKESFEDQYAAWENKDFDLKGKTTAEYMAEVRASDEAMRVGYGPIDFYDPKKVSDLQAALKTPSRSLLDGGAQIKALLPQTDFDNLLVDLVIETERAMGQRDRFKETNQSTASHGGSHDTCFAVILRKYIETDVFGRFGITAADLMKIDEPVRSSMLSMMGFANVLIELRNAVTRTEQALQLDPQEPNPEKAVKAYIADTACEHKNPPPVRITRLLWALSDAATVLQSLLHGNYGPLTKDEAEALATHRHYKGGLYYRLFDVKHTETQEALTVYFHLWPHEPSGFVRPVAMFEGFNNSGEPRFEKLR